LQQRLIRALAAVSSFNSTLFPSLEEIQCAVDNIIISWDDEEAERHQFLSDLSKAMIEGCIAAIYFLNENVNSLRLHPEWINSPITEDLYKGVTPLWVALANRQWELASEMLRRCPYANVDVTFPLSPRGSAYSGYVAITRDHTSLEEAEMCNSVEIIAEGTTALWLAVRQSKWDLVAVMLKHSPAITCAPKNCWGTPLVWHAARDGHWELVESLLPSLSFEQIEGYPKRAETLNDPMLRHPFHEATLLWFAAHAQKWDLVASILKAHPAANLNAAPAYATMERKEVGGMTVLWLAAYHMQWPLLLEMLSHPNADIDAAPKWGAHTNERVYDLFFADAPSEAFKLHVCWLQANNFADDHYRADQCLKRFTSCALRAALPFLNCWNDQSGNWEIWQLPRDVRQTLTVECLYALWSDLRDLPAALVWQRMADVIDCDNRQRAQSLIAIPAWQLLCKEHNTLHCTAPTVDKALFTQLVSKAVIDHGAEFNANFTAALRSKIITAIVEAQLAHHALVDEEKIRAAMHTACEL
jgi:ankyrin repeat protein